MMYRRPHINHKLLSSLVICGCVLVSYSHGSNAEDDGRSAPFRVYVPNVSALRSVKSRTFTTNKLQYDLGNYIVSAQGNVEIEQGDVIVRADVIEYDQMKESVRAYGNVVVLAADGNVSFSDELELKDGVRYGVIKRLQAEMMDNEFFMVAEAEKADALAKARTVKQVSVVTAGIGKDESFFSKLFAYISPELSGGGDPLHLAELAPAAGGNEQNNSPVVIGNQPLIVLPETDVSTSGNKGGAPEIVEPKNEEPKITEPKITETKPAEPKAVEPKSVGSDNAVTEAKTATAATPTPISTPDSALSSALAPAATAKPEDAVKPTKEEDPKPKTKSEEEPEKNPENKPVTESKKEHNDKIGKPVAEIPQEKKELKSEKPTSKKPVTEESVPVADVKNKSQPSGEASAENSAAEPAIALSPESRDLLDRLSPSIKAKEDKAAGKKLPLKVNHARDMQDLFKADELPASPASQSMGVKIENKSLRINLDYELEKAYNAINSGQSEAAMATYQKILDNSPNNTQALFGLATLYHRARQLDKARSLYSHLLSLDPQHRDGFNNFLVLLADEAPREASTELEKLEEKNPGFSTIPAQLAVIYQKLGESDKAIGKMFRAVALAPENLTYRYNLAIMLDKQKNYDEAAKLYRQLIEASERGEKIPGNIANLQQRLTFISSNR